MSKLPFKKMEVCDRFSPERIATFERPQENNDTIIINTNGVADFHLDAGTLRVVAEVLGLPSRPNSQLPSANS